MKLNYTGPVVLAILDGVGLRRDTRGNAVKLAHTEFLNQIVSNYPTIALQASGEAVGILPGTMGNSEVGHNTIGSGQISPQGVARINAAFDDGSIWASDAWRECMKRTASRPTAEIDAPAFAKAGLEGAGPESKNADFEGARDAGHSAGRPGTLHFSGIFSNGNVHSSILHLEHMIAKAHEEGVQKIRLHLVLDGRDTPPQSAQQFITEIEAFINAFEDHPDYRIASGGGRMIFVADRYENDWSVVEAGWNAIVHGRAGYSFTSALDAINSFRAKDPTLQDQYIPPFVIVENNQPVGKAENGDAFIYFDFRADRAIEIAQAFTYDDFPYFDRGERPDVYFAGMTEYNSDTHVPEHRLVEPAVFTDTLNKFVGENHLNQLAVAETVKFGHITYYFNGNSYECAPGEEHVEIPSDTLPFDTRPWMKAAETTDKVLEHLNEYDFVRVNYAGGDMVGHFAELEPTITALEAIDIQLARLAAEVDRLGGVLIVTADHGNAEELVDENGQPKTAHTTNLVPFIIYDNTENRKRYRLARWEEAAGIMASAGAAAGAGSAGGASTGSVAVSGFGLANVASTIALFLGLERYPASWMPPLIAEGE